MNIHEPINKRIHLDVYMNACLSQPLEFIKKVQKKAVFKMFLFCVVYGCIRRKQKHFLIPTETEMKVTRIREIHEWVFSLFCAPT